MLTKLFLSQNQSSQYSTGDSFKYGMIQLVIIWVGLILWTHYVMPLMGFNSHLW